MKKLSNMPLTIAISTMLLLLIIIVVIFFIKASVTQYKSQPVPLINGVALNQPLAIDNFILQDHHGEPFTRRDLLGKWHIVSYGYTNCPDVCPMTLTVLTRLAASLKQHNLINEVNLIFYTVDPLRDSKQHLAEYLAYFDPHIVGLRKAEDNSYQVFEKSLSITAMYQSPDADNNYSVSHGLTLLILNPEGTLQAILKPSIDPFGQASLSVDKLFEDFQQVRNSYHKRQSEDSL